MSNDFTCALDPRRLVTKIPMGIREILTRLPNDRPYNLITLLLESEAFQKAPDGKILSTWENSESRKWCKFHLWIKCADTRCDGYKPMSEEQAETLLEWYCGAMRPTKHCGHHLPLYVHCHAGVGRSPAVCAALDYVDGIPVYPWFTRYASLNNYIYNTITETWKRSQ